MKQRTGGGWTTTKLAAEAARRGKPVTREYIRQLCERGVIKAERPGHDWIIGDFAAQTWLETWIKGDR